MKDTYAEALQEIRKLSDVDVLVVGGGTSGTVAAIAAARQGVRVGLVEKFGSLGGLISLGLNTKPSGKVLGGIPLEIWDRAREMGGASQDYVAQLKKGKIEITSQIDPEILKLILVRMCTEAGVQLFFESLVCKPILEAGVIKGVIIENKGGRLFIESKVVIDCSADADVAARAGAPFVLGAGDEDNSMQPVSMYFMMRNVDLPRLADWSREHVEDIPDRNIPETPEELSYGLWLTGFNNMLKKFQKEKGVKLFRENITLKTANNEMYVNATRVLGTSGLDPLGISNAIVECYRQIEEYAKFLIEKVPGFEDSKIGAISPILGVRETRHITGGYVLTGEDVTSGAVFEDSIGVDMSAHDVHEVSGSDVDFRDLPPYEIPYRSLVPNGIEQLLVAGRCVSADHTAHGRTRNIPFCLSVGQAAGVAAAVSVKKDTPVRSVNIREVQEVIRKLGMPIHTDEIE